MSESLPDKVMGLYNAVKSDYYLCRNDLRIGNQRYNSTLLMGTITQLVNGSQILFGEYGGGKTTSAEYLNSIFNGIPLDLVRSVSLRGDPQKTDSKIVGRLHYGMLHAQKEVVRFQNFVLLGPKIIDEFNRIAEPNQSVVLDGVDRGIWTAFNAGIHTGPQPLYATCNYNDRGNNSLIPPMLDRFHVAVEASYPGLANDDIISDMFSNTQDALLENPEISERIARLMNGHGEYSAFLERLDPLLQAHREKLSARGLSPLSPQEKRAIQGEISRMPLAKDAHLYFLFLASELNVSHHNGMIRSIDEVSPDDGTTLGAMYRGSGSRRASKAVKKYARALAWLTGSGEVSLEHLLTVAPYTLWHRINWDSKVLTTVGREKRLDPDKLHTTSRMIDVGSSEYPGVKKRFIDHQENYRRVLDQVAHGDKSKAKKIAEQSNQTGKGHPVFVDALRDIEWENDALDQVAKKICKGTDKSRLRSSAVKRSTIFGGWERDETYGKALASLRKHSVDSLAMQHLVPGRRSDSIKPLSLKDSIEVIVNHYNSVRKDDAHEIFARGFYTSTGTLYRAHSTEFKIILDAHEELNVRKRFNKEGQALKYGKVNAEEFSTDAFNLDIPLTRAQVMNSLWVQYLGGDRNLVGELHDIISDLTQEDECMPVSMLLGPSSDQIRPVFITSAQNQLTLNAAGRLDIPCSFVRIDV